MGAKVTRIEKKYKDKKTGEFKTLVIDYSKVKDRLKEFWQDHPNGHVETTPTVLGDGRLMFRADIVTDRSTTESKKANGHALGETAGEKDFEKLETIAVGRALGLLGYSSDGEIASSEEMEAFNEYKKAQFEDTVIDLVSKINSVTTLDELKALWAPLTGELQKALLKVKDEKKNKLMNPDNENN